MSVFALENGRLVPAQAVNASDAGVTAESLAAIRERVVELIDVPLFPVAWQTEPAGDGSRESLIALDPTGQTVTVEVLDLLDADELLGSLARAGRHSEMSRSSLALIYGPGARSFPRDWHLFLDACPPNPNPGPRLYLVVLGIDDGVKAAVDALAGAGLDVRRASLHDGGNQVLVSFDEVRPQPGRLGAILSSAQHHYELLLPDTAAGADTTPEPAATTPEPAEPAASTPEPVVSTPESVAPVSAPASPKPTTPEPAASTPESVAPVSAPASPKPTTPEPAASTPEPVATTPEPAAPPAPEPATPASPKPTAPTTSDQISMLKAMLEGQNNSSPRRSHHSHASRSTRSSVGGSTPSAFAGVPNYAGPTAFAQAQDSSKKRAEQDLWDNSAPSRGGRPAPRTISESSAATSSSEAVQEAASVEHGAPSGRLVSIAQRYGAPFTVVWRQRRRNISLSARVTAWGTIVLSDGRVFTDPSDAAQAASGIAGVDGWSVWRIPGGKRLGEL